MKNLERIGTLVFLPSTDALEANCSTWSCDVVRGGQCCPSLTQDFIVDRCQQGGTCAEWARQTTNLDLIGTLALWQLFSSQVLTEVVDANLDPIALVGRCLCPANRGPWTGCRAWHEPMTSDQWNYWA